MSSRTTVTLISALALITGSGLLIAGPLNPPAGAVSASMKTLAEVEARTAVSAANTPGDATAVFVISQPGSYYLAGNIASPAGKSAVRITADNVTLDLNGFSVTGPAGPVLVHSSYERTVVLNGHVTGGTGGVSVGPYAKVSGVQVKGCAGIGIAAGGESTVTDCDAVSCMIGISVGNWRSLVERCHASYCSEYGMSVGRDSRVVSCASTGNTGHGFDLSGTATGCTASENGEEGFILSWGGIANDCTSRDNTGNGFLLYNGSGASGCSSTSNGAYGFQIDIDCTLRGCKASTNAVSAVRAIGSYSRVEGCTLRGAVGFPVVQLDNVAGTRIEGNSLYGGTFAVSAGASANGVLITGNQCVGNTSGAFNVNLANNQVGPSVTAAGTIASTSPWANFVR